MIHIFTTGGSLDKTYSTLASDFVVGDPQIATVLQEANAAVPLLITPLLRKDSLSLTDDDRATIAAAVVQSLHQQIIITHGTDTMTQTAAALAHIRAKTIVLTGAMQPAAFKITDAVFNIGCGVAAVQLLPAGVYIVMSGRVFAWDKTRKNMQTNQFEDSE